MKGDKKGELRTATTRFLPGDVASAQTAGLTDNVSLCVRVCVCVGKVLCHYERLCFIF
jgi:hypothetical protein